MSPSLAQFEIGCPGALVSLRGELRFKEALADVVIPVSNILNATGRRWYTNIANGVTSQVCSLACRPHLHHRVWTWTPHDSNSSFLFAVVELVVQFQRTIVNFLKAVVRRHVPTASEDTVGAACAFVAAVLTGPQKDFKPPTELVYSTTSNRVTKEEVQARQVVVTAVGRILTDVGPGSHSVSLDLVRNLREPLHQVLDAATKLKQPKGKSSSSALSSISTSSSS